MINFTVRNSLTVNFSTSTSGKLLAITVMTLNGEVHYKFTVRYNISIYHKFIRRLYGKCDYKL